MLISLYIIINRSQFLENVLIDDIYKDQNKTYWFNVHRR